MAAHAQPLQPDALHRALSATWHVLRAGAAAVARWTVAAIRWCRGEDVDHEQKRLSRAERKRLRKAKLRRFLGSKNSA